MILGYAAVGGTFVIAPMFTPLGTLEVIQQQKVTHLLLVPTMIQLAIDHPDAGEFDLGSVEMLAYGGSVDQRGGAAARDAALSQRRLLPGLRHDRTVALRHLPAA